MGFNLRKLLDEGAAQVNPFDHGATAATVRAQPAPVAAPKPPPAVTVRRQTITNNGGSNPFSTAYHDATNFASKTVNQVNPFDNGRTWKQQTPTNNASLVHQATHNGATNVAGDAVKFIPQFAVDYANAAGNLGRRAANATPVIHQGGAGTNGVQVAPQTPQQQFTDPLTSRTVKMSDATGTGKQLASDAAQVALSAFTPGVDKAAATVAGKVLPSVAPKITTKLLPHMISGATAGAGFSGSQGFGEGHTAKEILTKDVPTGAAFGAVAPVAGEILSHAAPVVATVGKNVAKGTARKVVAVATNQPGRNVSDAELAAANRFRRSQTGWPDNTQAGDYEAYRRVQQKIGTTTDNGTAFDDLVNARQTYDNHMQSIKQNFKPMSLNQTGSVSGDSPLLPVNRAVSKAKGRNLPQDNATPIANVLEQKQAKLTAAQNATSKAQAKEVKAAEDAYINKKLSAAGLEKRRAQIAAKYAPTTPEPIVNGPGDPNIPVPGDIPTTNAGKVKQTRFTSKTVQNSDMVSDPVKAQTDAAYTSDTMQGALARAQQSIADTGHTNALNQTLSELNAKRGTASRDTLARAIELAAHHDELGTPQDQAISSQLYNLVGEHGSASGQQSQILAMIARRSPAGLRNKAFNDLKNKGGIDLFSDNSKQIGDLTAQAQKFQPGSPEHISTMKQIGDLQAQDEAKTNLKNEIQGHIDAIKNLPDGQAKDYQIAVLQKAVAKHLPQSATDKALSLWKAGLLSGVRTHGGNIISNATFEVLKKASDVPAAIVDKAISLGTKERAKTYTGRGIVSGTAEGTKNAYGTLKTGIDTRNIGDKYEQHAELNFNNPLLHNVLAKPANGVFRLLGAADQPTFYATLKNSLYDQAKADGLNKGLSGRALSRHMRETVANPTESMVATAEKEANKSVLSYDTYASKAISGAHRAIDQMPGASTAGKQAAHATLNVLAPFVRVPSAFISRTIDFTPLGIPKEVLSQVAHKKFDQRALSQAIGEATTGTGVLGLGIALSQSGLISGDYPKNDPKEAARWKAQGITPNSVRIGGQWKSLNYLGPVGLLFNAGHQIQQAKGASVTTKVAQALTGLGQGLMGQSFLQGFSGFSDAIQNPSRSAKSFVNSEVSSIVPGLSNDVANATDKFQRTSDTVPEAIKNRIPGLRESNPIKTDVYGNDLKQPSSGLNVINPLRPSNDISSPVLSEVARLHNSDPNNPDLQVTPTPIKNSLVVDKNTVNLSNDQKNALQKSIGQQTQQVWGDAIKSDIYKSLDDAGKAKMLDNLRTDAQTLAERKYVTDNNLGTYSKPVTNRAAAMGSGQIDLASYVGKAADGSSSYIPKDDRGTALLARIGSMSKTQQQQWATKSLDPKYQDLYTRSKQLVPSGLPDLPQTNSTLQAYGTYLKTKQKNPTPLELNNAKKTFLKASYGASLSKNSQDLLGSSSTAGDKYNAISSGQIPQQDVSDAVAYDNFLITSGLASTPKISNTLRRKLGIGDAPMAGGGSGGRSGGSSSKKKFDVYANLNVPSYEKKMRDLVTAAHL